MMKLGDIMTPDVECVRPGDTLHEAARKMKSLDVGLMPVCGDNDKIVGMLTDRDITIRATAEGLDPKATRVQDAMSEDVIWCFEDQDADDAAKLMQERQVRRLLVMSRDKRLVGIVSLGDLATEGKKKQAGEVLQDVSEPSRPRR
jgi:CBS domain-containing protein